MEMISKYEIHIWIVFISVAIYKRAPTELKIKKYSFFS